MIQQFSVNGRAITKVNLIIEKSEWGNGEKWLFLVPLSHDTPKTCVCSQGNQFRGQMG